MKKSFLIKGYDRKNKIRVEFNIKAKDKEKAKAIAHNKGISVFNVYETFKYSENELIDFFENFLILLKAKTKIKDIFEILDSGEKDLKLETLYQFLKEGYSLSEALKNVGVANNPFIQAMLKAGEQSGNFEKSINNILNYLKMKKYVKDNMKSALIYPAFIIGASVFTIIIVLLYIVPAFENLYSLYGNGEVPLLTSLLIKSSHFLKIYDITIFLSLLLTVILIHQYKNLFFKFFLKVITKMPGLKNSVYYFLKHQQYELLYILTEGNIRIFEAIVLIEKIPLASIEKEKLKQIINYLKEGLPLSVAFEKTSFSSHRDLNIIKSGESSGNLEESFKLLSLLYKKKIDSFIFLLTKLLEPVFILLIGTIVGLILVSLYLPLFDMAGILK